MNEYLIALIILFSVTLIFIILFIVNMVFIWMFSSMLRQHNKALTILLVQKYEAIESLINIYKKNDIEISQEIIDIYNSVSIESFKKMDTLQCSVNREKLSLLKQDIIGLVKHNEDFQKNEEFKLTCKMLSSIDYQFRQVSAAYNADVIGYNYWVRFRIFRYLFLYNHVGLKDIIS